MLFLISSCFMDNRDAFKKNLGRNLRQLRLERKMSLEQLAMESGMVYSQVSRIELGKIVPNSYTLFQLSQVLGVCPSVFFTDVRS